jgi:hypothetical protein
MSNVASVDPTKTVDHYDLDDVDATHPAHIAYVVPVNTGIIKVTLSFHRRAFRSTVNLTPSTIGTDATGSSGHNHNHAHTIPIGAGPFANAVGLAGVAGGNLLSATVGNTAAINADATGESGHSHSHSHTLTGSGAQSVTDGVIGTITAISFDGIDKTAALGGPWSGDVVELDISSVFPKTPTVWHLIALTPSGLTRVVSLLRIYYTT